MAKGRSSALAPTRFGRVLREPRSASDHAIGVFDSGIGGLTVLKALARLMPREQLIYLGDTARVPYGSRSSETVIAYSIENTDFLVERAVKLLVVACNTSSAVALDVLAERYSIPVIGVIQPGARAAIEATRRGRVGVIGTEATINSGAYDRVLRSLRPDVEIFTRACPMFVPLAEEGWVANDVARRTVVTYLTSLKRSGIDTLILGCTHYPLLHRLISAFLGPEVRLVDSAQETAREVHGWLSTRGITRRGGRATAPSFFITDNPDRFARVGERFYGASVTSAVRIVLRGEPAITPRAATMLEPSVVVPSARSPRPRRRAAL